MQSKKTVLRFLLLLAVALVLGAFLVVNSGEAFELLPGQSWDATPTALARTAAGDCPAGMVCREFCYYGEPQGQFRCFNH